MRALEIITLSTFFGGVAFAEYIPLCVLMLAISFSCGFICAKLCEQNEEEEE